MKYLSHKFARFYKKAFLSGVLLVVLLSYFNNLNASITNSPIPKEVQTSIKNSTKASIVFATENLRTPISSFGHSFLVFHQKNLYPSPSDIALEFVFDNSKSMNLITSLISYAPGSYKAQYFINKEKEYSNENRNLWVIPLKLTEQELISLKQNAFQKLLRAQTTKSRYNFFSSNCSSYTYQLVNQSFDSNSRCRKTPFYTIPEESLDWLKKCHRLEESGFLRQSHYQLYNENNFENIQQKKSLILNLKIPHESSMLKRDIYYKQKKRLGVAAPSFIKRKNLTSEISSKSILSIEHTQKNLSTIRYEVALKSPRRKPKQLFADELSIAALEVGYKNDKVQNKNKWNINSFYLFKLSSQTSSNQFFKGFTREISLGYQEYDRIIPNFSFGSFKYASGKTLKIAKRIKLSLLIGNQTGIISNNDLARFRSPFFIQGKVSARLWDIFLSFEKTHYLDNAFSIQNIDRAQAFIYLSSKISLSAQWLQINKVKQWSGVVSFSF